MSHFGVGIYWLFSLENRSCFSCFLSNNFELFGYCNCRMLETLDYSILLDVFVLAGNCLGWNQTANCLTYTSWQLRSPFRNCVLQGLVRDLGRIYTQSLEFTFSGLLLSENFPSLSRGFFIWLLQLPSV